MDSLPRTYPYNRGNKSPDRMKNHYHGGEKAVSPQSEVNNVSVDSAYFTSPESHTTGSPAEICAMRPRSSTWLASLQSLLQKRKLSAATTLTSTSLVYHPGLSAVVESLDEPRMEDELDRFLFEVWIKDAPHSPRTTVSPVSLYVKKVGELKAFFELKMAEISQKETTYLNEFKCFNNTSLTTSDQYPEDNIELREILTGTKVEAKFDQLRLKLKQEVAQTILQLRAQYISDPGRRIRGFRPKTTKILSEWYEQHVKHPYPTALEKKLLASQCDISVEQVTTWFNNKRCRSKTRETHKLF